MPEELRVDRFNRTRYRESYLISKGYKVVSKKECEYRIEREMNSDMKAFSVLPEYARLNRGKITEEKIISDVISGLLFGMVEVDIQVPKEWGLLFKSDLSPYEYFEEFPPLFCTTNIEFEKIGDHMQQHARAHNMHERPRRLLVGGMKAERLLLATPLLKWYLEHGLEVTTIYQIIEFTPKRCFKNFEKAVTEARRKGDQATPVLDPSPSHDQSELVEVGNIIAERDVGSTSQDSSDSRALISNSMKLLGNAAYGSLIMNKEKHRNVIYLDKLTDVKVKINQKQFRGYNKIDDLYELEMGKKKIVLDLPIYLGYFILQYAKLRLIDFYYSFIDTFISRDNYRFIESDTDSIYFAIAGDSLADVIKPEKYAEYIDKVEVCRDVPYEANSENWLPRTCCEKHKKHDLRTVGLFKLEGTGTEMICLCSKTYLLKKEGDEVKFSCKGINKNRLEDPLTKYEHVLRDEQAGSGVNKGFRAKDNTIYTYSQERSGLSYFYCKRVVQADRVSTKPLDIVLNPYSSLGKRFVFSYGDILANDFPCKLKFNGCVFASVWEVYSHVLVSLNNLTVIEKAALKREEDLGVEWLSKRCTIMKNIMKLKFDTVPGVKETLMGTDGSELIYAVKDNFWGIGINKRLADVCDDRRGSNRLGLIWGEIRDTISHDADLP